MARTEKAYRLSYGQGSLLFTKGSPQSLSRGALAGEPTKYLTFLRLRSISEFADNYPLLAHNRNMCSSGIRNQSQIRTVQRTPRNTRRYREHPLPPSPPCTGFGAYSAVSPLLTNICT